MLLAGLSRWEPDPLKALQQVTRRHAAAAAREARRQLRAGRNNLPTSSRSHAGRSLRSEAESSGVPALPNVKTARRWRGIVALYAPRAGGAYDSHHRTAGIAGCTRRRGAAVWPL